MNVYCLCLPDDLTYDAVADLNTHISRRRRNKILTINNEAKQLESLMTALFVRYVCSQELTVSPASLIFEKLEEGKPYLPDYPQFFHSTTQKAQRIVVATHDAYIGADVEKLTDYKSSIAKRFFTVREQSYIENAKEQRAAFFEVWTKKEAYVKMLGTGFGGKGLPPTAFDVFELEEKKTCRFQVFAKDDYLITVCAGTISPESVTYKEVSFEEMQNFYKAQESTPKD